VSVDCAPFVDAMSSGRGEEGRVGCLTWIVGGLFDGVKVNESIRDRHEIK
jgi:hypothetical protein